MAQLRSVLATTYPLPASNFRVTVNGTSMRFSRVSGLAHEYETLTYRDGLSFLDGEKLVKHFVDKWVPVTLEQGIIPGDGALHSWLSGQVPRAVEIQLCDADGTARLTWRLRKAYAIKLSAPTFDAAGNEAAVDTLELRVAGIVLEEK